MATYAQFKHVELYKIGHGKNRVPNAPKSCIGEIFSSDATDGGSPVKNGVSRPRVPRDTPTRPRDTHSRLFGQGRAMASPISPLVTDNIRSNIQFGEHANGGSPAHSPSKPLANGHGSASSTPSRGEPDTAEHSSYAPPKRNPVTGDGVTVPLPRRRHPAASLRGAHPEFDLLQPQPTHRYVTNVWPPVPGEYYVESTFKPRLTIEPTPYSLIGLDPDNPKILHPQIDPDSLSPQPIVDKHWPPFPAQHYLEPSEKQFPYHPLPTHAFVGMTSALGERPKLDYKYNPIPSFDGIIDPYLVANNNPTRSIFKYEKDGPIPDVSLFETPVAPGPHTLTGFPPIFHKHVPGYLYSSRRNVEDFRPRQFYVDYVRQREMEGNPITGDGYKSMNGQINTVTSISGHSSILHNRVPPGGFSSGLW